MSLKIITGGMFSGKSTELLRLLSTYVEIGSKCLYINHSKDDRNKTTDVPFSTHHPFLIPKNYQAESEDNTLGSIEFKSMNSLNNLILESYDVIAIDEAHFFDKSLIDFCTTHVETYKKDRLFVSDVESYLTILRARINNLEKLYPLPTTPPEPL